MSSIDIIKPQCTVLGNVIDKPQQLQNIIWNFLGEWWHLSPGPQGKKRVCYPLCYSALPRTQVVYNIDHNGQTNNMVRQMLRQKRKVFFQTYKSCLSNKSIMFYNELIQPETQPPFVPYRRFLHKNSFCEYAEKDDDSVWPRSSLIFSGLIPTKT